MAKYFVIILGALLIFGSLNSCSEDPPTGGKDSCDTCNVPCDTCEVPCDTCDTTKPPCDTCGIDKDSAAHAFIWTQYTIPNESNLTGCWVFGENNIFVMGSKLYHFNGSTWDRFPLKIEGAGGREALLTDGTMFAFTENEMWFIHGVIYHYRDGWVQEYRNISDTTFQGVIACWGTSSNDMFFVGVKGNISHFDGTTFTKMTSPTTKDLRSVWGTSHNDVWASGANLSTGETTLLHYDGTSWKEDELALTGSARTSGLSATWGCDSAGHKFVIASGAHVYRKTDNGLWRNDSTLVPNELGGGTFVGIYLLSGNNANDFVGTGGWGWVGHWNGKSWKRYDELYNYSILNYTSGGLSMKGNTICVVGLKSGKSWIAIGRRKPF